MSAATASTFLAPSPVFTGRLSAGWSFEVFDRVDALDPAFWRAQYPDGWKDERYYRTLEETFAGEFTQFFLVLRDDGGQARALQPLFFVEQDLTVSLGVALRAALRPLRRWLRLRLMMVGCIVGDGQIGVPEPGDVPGVVASIHEALERFARQQRVSIIVFKDFPATYRTGLAPLTQRWGYTRLASLPAVSLRRKFREVDMLAEPIALEVKTTVSKSEAGTLHSLYERVALSGDMHFEVFDKEYFLKLGERMPDQTRFFIWRQAGKIVAFSFCTVHGDTLYDNDLGLDEDAAAALHLYHVTFRDIVRWALAHGLKRYCSSPFNYDPKLHLRMELVPLDLYVRHLSPAFNALVRRFAPMAAPTRLEPVLRQFPNVDEL